MNDNTEKSRFARLQAYLLGAAAVVAAMAALIGNIGSLRDAWCKNIGVFCRRQVVIERGEQNHRGPVDLKPYGIELTALTDPHRAVQDAEKAKSIAPPGAEIRLYKRMTRQGTIAWAPVVVYTDSSIASNDRSRYEGKNDWDPEL